MRRVSVLLGFATACARPVPPAPIASHHEARVAIALDAKLVTADYRDLELFGLPPLPPKRGLDLVEEATCRAHYAHVLAGRGSSDVREDDLRRLARIASQITGDCRIDADALFAEDAPYNLGGCTGTAPAEAIIAWRRIAAVASTRARRAAALRNLAALAWRIAVYDVRVDAWIDVGDAYVLAADADPNDPVLSRFAVDAYENALRVPFATDIAIEPAQRRRVARGLERITDGAAGDRARALRLRL